jgi:hypothetical protein
MNLAKKCDEALSNVQDARNAHNALVAFDLLIDPNEQTQQTRGELLDSVRKKIELALESSALESSAGAACWKQKILPPNHQLDPYSAAAEFSSNRPVEGKHGATSSREKQEQGSGFLSAWQPSESTGAAVGPDLDREQDFAQDWGQFVNPHADSSGNQPPTHKLDHQQKLNP